MEATNESSHTLRMSATDAAGNTVFAIEVGNRYVLDDQVWESINDLRACIAETARCLGKSDLVAKCVRESARVAKENTEPEAPTDAH